MRVLTMFKWRWLLAGLFVVAASGPVRAQGAPSSYSRTDIEAGAKLYAAQCVTCHGPSGDAIAGVDLSANKFRTVSTDQDLMNAITNGVPQSGMPPQMFKMNELVGLVAYIRNMRNFGSDTGPVGDASRGRAIFEGKGDCRSCHRVGGQGGRSAPDLSTVGTLRSAELIRNALVDPKAGLIPINRPVRAVTKDGKVINGRRLNEDTFTVQLADESGRLISLIKSDLREFTILTVPRMPSYQGKLTPEELADLLSYLLSLKG
jgi:putative heme-binding domain-containing protein